MMQPDIPFVEILTQYNLLAVFSLAFFFGDTAVMAAAYVAAQLEWSVVAVFLMALLGTVTADTLWFYFGRKILLRLHKWNKLKHKYERVVKKLERMSERHLLLSLLYVKFLYGTRIVTILYLSWRRITIPKFIMYDTLGVIGWLLVLLPIGWLAGKGVANFVPIIDSAAYFLLALVVMVLLVRFVSSKVSDKLLKK